MRAQHIQQCVFLGLVSLVKILRKLVEQDSATRSADLHSIEQHIVEEKSQSLADLERTLAVADLERTLAVADWG